MEFPNRCELWLHVERNVADMIRWRMITAVFAIPVAGYTIKMVVDEFSGEHHDYPEIPAYEYMQVSSRVPRFPWGYVQSFYAGCN